MKVVNQIFDFIRLQNIFESWHSSATIVDLMFDLLLFQTPADCAQIRSKAAAYAVHAMAMLAALLMKQCGSSLLTSACVGNNGRISRLWKATRQTCRTSQTGDGIDSDQNFTVFTQGSRVLSVTIIV
jgi:hypothetical protein